MGLGQSAESAALPINRQVYQSFSKLNLPRHTSYPAVPFWNEAIGESVFSSKLREIAHQRSAVSFYLHVPFCERLCHYCGCNKLVISRSHGDSWSFAQRFIESLRREINWINQARGNQPWAVHQIHWGGGTPTWLTLQELEQVWSIFSSGMKIDPHAEISVEIDPRITSVEQLQLLKDLGFNRVSLGIQDFDDSVQKAIQRIQPLEMVERFVDECRRIGFRSVNFDLIYGLPMQTRISMEETLGRVVRMSPDRIAFYRLALLPDIFKWQRTFKSEDIPSDDAVLDFMLRAIEVFGTNGWQFIGLDHFANEDDELTQALKSGTLRRSFQGMTTGSELPVIGVGPSAISGLNDLYVQNESQFPNWSKRMGHSGSAIVRGHQMTGDDRLRQWVISQLYCYRRIDKSEFQLKFGVNFDSYFARSHTAWREMGELGLIEDTLTSFRVRPLTGWLLLRVIASSFDGYLPVEAWKVGLQNGASRVG